MQNYLCGRSTLELRPKYTFFSGHSKPKGVQPDVFIYIGSQNGTEYADC